MRMQAVPAALRERLGPAATAGLVEFCDEAGREWTDRVIELAGTRFDARLVEEASKVRVDLATGLSAVRQEMATGLSAVRQEMAAGLSAVRQEMATGQAGLRQEMATLRVELIKWSFVFWVGQVVAIGGLLLALNGRG